MALIEHHHLSKPHKFDNLIGKYYELAVNQSIQSLLDSLHETVPNLSVFTSNFLQLMQSKPDPPLEIIWVFSALTFHTNDSPKEEPLDQFLALKGLFQSISACSASCSSSKSIALVAPVIYELHRLIVNLKVRNVGYKAQKKMTREIKSFLDVILGYMNLCYFEGTHDDEGLGLGRPLSDLVSVWMEDAKMVENGGKEESRLFFPFLGDQIFERIISEGCVVSELAGAVIAEAFVLRLCLSFGQGNSREELQNELRTWAVGFLTGFPNFHFFDMVVKMLLELHLPVTSLLSSEDELILRKVLYDVVILVEYSFLNPDRMAHLPTEHIKSILVHRLMVIHEAVELFRGTGDQTKAISYVTAFSGSHLAAQLIKLVKSETDMDVNTSELNGSSPKSLLKWLLNIEDQGIRLFDGAVTKYRERLILGILKADSDQPGYIAGGKKSDNDLLFFIDHTGKPEVGDDEDEEMKESMSSIFMAAAHTIQLAESGGKRKRRKRKGADNKKQVKFHKYDLFDHFGLSDDKSTFSDKGGSVSGSEVENPDCDEDV